MARLVAFTLVLVPLLAFAQAPGQIQYQGRLLKTDGTPEVGVVSMDFALCDSAAGLTCSAQQTLTVALSDGFYSVFLNVAPADLVGPRFFSIKVGGTELIPRQALGSAPYAVVAGNLKGGTVDASQVTVGTNATIGGNLAVGGKIAVRGGPNWSTPYTSAASTYTHNLGYVPFCMFTTNGQVVMLTSVTSTQVSLALPAAAAGTVYCW